MTTPMDNGWMRQPTHELAEMTWPEVEEARVRAPLAIVPTGACEQHGHHMALQTDTVRGREVAALVAHRLAPSAVVTPCLNVGVSPHHMGFPGTLTLSAATFQQVLYEVVDSLHRHGWRKVFILNGHGGNNSATGVAVSRLQYDLPDLHIAWSGITPLVKDVASKYSVSDHAGHSSEIETSQTMHLAPDLVRMDELAQQAQSAGGPPRFDRMQAATGIHAPQPFDQLSPDGATGCPDAATREAGEELVRMAVDRLTEFLRQFINREPQPGPLTGDVRTASSEDS